MTQTLVCGEWPLELQPGTGGHYQYLSTASSKNASCFAHLVKDLPQGLSVVEYFGGVGQFSTVIQQLLSPSRHHAFDLDLDCVRQLQTIPGILAAQGDAKETMGTIPSDLVVLDFAYATIKHHDDWPWGKTLIEHPRYVVWSDTAARRIGLHRALYSKIFGTPILGNEDYYRAYSWYLWTRYGYRVTRVAHHVYSYLLAEPVGEWMEHIDITRVTR